MSNQPPRRRPLAHPAALSLAAAGSSLRDVAEQLNVTPQMVSFYLCGKYRTPDRMPEVLRSLVGDDHTRRVLELIPTRDGQRPST
jgi:predicted transcriptional regulator